MEDPRPRQACLALLFGLLALFARPATPTEPVRLASDGWAAAVIVVPPGADDESIEWQTAELLAEHIKKMSGALLPLERADRLSLRMKDGQLVMDDADNSSTVGTFVLVGESQWSRALGVTADGLGIGGIRVTTAGNAVVLLGGPAGEVGKHYDPDGVRYAGIELLEQLGFRYLWPGELGLVVPDKPTVEVDVLDIAFSPPIGQRHIRMPGGWSGRWASGLDDMGVTRAEWDARWDAAKSGGSSLSWRDWQRLGGETLPGFGHARGGLERRHLSPRTFLETKPEWYALQSDGTRLPQPDTGRWRRLCLSNPELIEAVANDIIEQVHKYPDIGLYSLCLDDTTGVMSYCLCSDCMALDPPDGPKITLPIRRVEGTDEGVFDNQFWADFGENVVQVAPGAIKHVSLTDRVLYYWNSIAARVAEVHPELLFGVTPYSVYADPPVERRAHPNLVARYVPQDLAGWQGWVDAGVQHMYWRPNLLAHNRRHGKLYSNVGQAAELFNFFSDDGLSRTDIDSISHLWATTGLSFYAVARLNWNPALSADEIIADYAQRGFGPGASYIIEYFQRVEALTGIVSATRHGEHATPADYAYTAETAATLRALLNNAAEAAEGDGVVQARVAFLRMGLNFTELHDLLADKNRRARDGEAVDMAYARRLVDLNCLMLHDLLRNHTMAIHVPRLLQMAGNFWRFRDINGRRVMPSDASWLERLDDPRYGLTGREQGIAEMLAAYGL